MANRKKVKFFARKKNRMVEVKPPFMAPKPAPAPMRKPGIFSVFKDRVFSVIKPRKTEGNVTPADKLFNKKELHERFLKGLDSHKLAKVKDMEKAGKSGMEMKDFIPKSSPKDNFLPEVIGAEELANPDDRIAAKEQELKDKAEAEQEAEAEGGEDNPMQGGDIFTSPDTSEEAISHAINTLKNPENIKHFTELFDFEIKGIAALKASNTKTQIPVLEEFITEFENLRVSLARKGRIEITEVSKAALSGNQQQQADGFMKRFFQH